MTLRQRIPTALGLLALGALAVLFLGGEVGRCLGPLGVTAVQCIRAGGFTPTVGIGMPIGAAAMVVAALLLLPLQRATALQALIGGVTGAAILGSVYWAVHPTSMTGAISTGEVITVPLPLDTPALLAAGIVGAGVGFLVGGRLHLPAAMHRT